MALALALALVIVWTFLVAALLVSGRLRARPDWRAWDVLRGVRVLTVERFSESLMLRLAMVAGGHHWGIQAQDAHDAEGARSLARAMAASDQVLTRQLDQELAGYARHAKVLHAAAELPALDSQREPRLLTWVAGLDRALALCVAPVTRLRVRLWALRLGLLLHARRLDRLRRDDDPRRTLAAGPALQADLGAFARATVATYSALLAALDSSRTSVRVH